jgi:hypothetical protein
MSKGDDTSGRVRIRTVPTSDAWNEHHLTWGAKVEAKIALAGLIAERCAFGHDAKEYWAWYTGDLTKADFAAQDIVSYKHRLLSSLEFYAETRTEQQMVDAVALHKSAL